MKLILITPPTPHAQEIEILQTALELGIDRIHIRKPNIDLDLLETYIQELGEKIIEISALHYYGNLIEKYSIPIFHLQNNNRKKILDEYNNIQNNTTCSFSTSFHHPSEIISEGTDYNYAFCSPVFPSISKKGYNPTLSWDLNKIKPQNTEDSTLPELIALGGISSDKVSQCQEKGFDGVAVLGNIWNQQSAKKSIRELKKIKAICDHLS